MHVRLITVQGASRLDDAVSFIKETVLADLRQQKGFNSINVSGNRVAGVFGVLTVWETEADRDSSEGFSEKARNQTLEILGGQLEVEHFEQVLSEVGSTPPAPGAMLLVRPVKMDPASVDENLEFFKQAVLPEIKAMPGFLAVRELVNRKSGESRVGTVWADTEALETAVMKSEERRQIGESRGVVFGENQILEVLFRAE